MKNIVVFIISIALFIAVLFIYSKNNNQINSPAQQATASPVAAQPTALDFRSLLTISDDSQRTHQLELFFVAEMKSRPDYAIKMISDLNDIDDRQLSYRLALSAWYQEDASSFSNWLSNFSPASDLDTAITSLFKTDLLSSDDLELSLLLTEKIFDEQSQQDAISKFLDSWAVAEPERILLWSLQNDGKRDTWLVQLFERLTVQSLSTTVESLSLFEQATPEQLHKAIQTIIDFYQSGSADSKALSAMKTLMPYHIREELIGALLPILLQEDEGLTLDKLNLLIGSLNKGSPKDAYYEQLALSWAIKSPNEAAIYAASLTGETRSIAVNGVVTSWIQTDLESADQWLKTVDGDIDLAANTLGRGSADLGNVQIADEWINNIKNEQLRTDAIVDVINRYYQESPEAGIYHLVYQKSLSTQQKLDFLHQKYPGELFVTPMDALDNIGRLENLKLGF